MAQPHIGDTVKIDGQSLKVVRTTQTSSRRYVVLANDSGVEIKKVWYGAIFYMGPWDGGKQQLWTIRQDGGK